MKTQKALKIVRFCLPVVMVAVWGGIPLTAQETSDFWSLVVLDKSQEAESTASPIQARLPQEPTCLIRGAQKIHPNSKITVTRPDGEKLQGRFLTIDPRQSLLMMTPLDRKDTSVYIYQISDIAKIQYSKKPGWGFKNMALGFLIGGAVGALIGLPLGDVNTEIGMGGGASSAPASAFLAPMGALMGWSIGAKLPAIRTIECK